MQQKYVRREDTTACQAHAVPPLPRSSSPTWDEKLKGLDNSGCVFCDWVRGGSGPETVVTAYRRPSRGNSQCVLGEGSVSTLHQWSNEHQGKWGWASCFRTPRGWTEFRGFRFAAFLEKLHIVLAVHDENLSALMHCTGRFTWDELLLLKNNTGQFDQICIFNSGCCCKGC